MEFKDPWILIFIPLIALVLFWVKRREESPAIRFSSSILFAGLNQTWKTRFKTLPFVLRLVVGSLFIFALAGPRVVLEESKNFSEGIDIVLTIDASGSMAAEDFTINGRRFNRLYVIKEVVKEFVESRKTDRLGLVAFGALAYTICPLTLDHPWLLENLDRIELGLIQDGTAIGSGISSALNRLKNSSAKSKVIILFTDGVNNAGTIDPITAAKAAQALGIKIYTIGAGSKGLVPFPVIDIWGRKVYENYKVDLDEDTLKKIAEITGGSYFRATDTESLRQIYKEIDRLEKVKFEEVGYKEYKELFSVFLLMALGLLTVEIILAKSIFLQIP